jgi:lichenan operon transcriptional antiterminator
VLERSASRARLRGTEMAQRRLLSRLVHEETDDGAFDLDAVRRTLGGIDRCRGLRPVQSRPRRGARELGYFVNEFGIGDVMLHVAITADRVAHGRALEVTLGETTAR